MVMRRQGSEPRASILQTGFVPGLNDPEYTIRSIVGIGRARRALPVFALEQ